MNDTKYKIPDTAMVFAAGLGTRMRPITDTIPKPMVKINGRPLIDYRLDKLIEAGVWKIVINTFYLPEIIEEHVRKRKDAEIIISRESIRLETGGGLVKALPYLGKAPFFIVNSDVIWIDKGEPALARLAQSWNDSEMDALLLLHEVERTVGYNGNGDFELESNKLRISMQPKRRYVFTGIQIFNPILLEGFTESVFSLIEVYKKNLLNNGILNRICGLEHNGDWLHIDSQEGIDKAEEYLKSA